jgi:phosphoglycerol transferase MdoB-like AlkP superfamily enzyme
MAFFQSKIKSSVILIASLIGMYTLLRVAFILVNNDEFQLENVSALIPIFWHGMRFDLSAIFLTNGIFFLLFMLPFSTKIYNNILKYFFLTVNILFLVLNCVDIAYYPFVQKRLQLDTFRFLTGDKGTEFYGLVPTFLQEYWYMILFFGFLVMSLFYIYKKATSVEPYFTFNVKSGIGFFSGFVATALIILVGIRGGLQLRPLSVINASESVEVSLAPIVLNSTFSLIRTAGKKAMQEANFIETSQLTECDKGLHIPTIVNDTTQKLNVVIILVESLSKQYLSYYNGTSKTPFLDSLIKEGFIFSNGFANARESIQGIPAVLASIPSLQDEPFIFSKYSSNNITSIASTLKPEGYTSAFYHGAALGTMGFHPFVKLAGFDHYYSSEDYPRPEDHDGAWGIWDLPYLKYMAQDLSKTPEPFVASVFTLNPHHPFRIPEEFQKKFNQKGHPIFPCISYLDYSLKMFFEEAKEQPWYSNTLFVITADHTGPNTDVMKTQMDEYRVPIIFFRPDGSLKGTSETIANQMDIMPTILGQLGYQKPFYSLGHNLFSDDCPHAAIFYKMGIFHYVDDQYYYQWNGEKGVGLYDWKQDKYLLKNLIKDTKFSAEINKCDIDLKKVIQNYTNNMIQNKMNVASKTFHQ